MKKAEAEMSLAWYTGGNFDKLNDALRNNKKLTEDQRYHLKNIDNAFEMVNPILDPITVYKGIDNHIMYKKDKAFISTSTDIKEAMKFVENGCCMLVIHVSPKSKILPIKHISRYSEESEILLDRNGLMLGTGKSYIKNGTTMIECIYGNGNL